MFGIEDGCVSDSLYIFARVSSEDFGMFGCRRKVFPFLELFRPANFMEGEGKRDRKGWGRGAGSRRGTHPVILLYLEENSREATADGSYSLDERRTRYV